MKRTIMTSGMLGMLSIAAAISATGQSVVIDNRPKAMSDRDAEKTKYDLDRIDKALQKRNRKKQRKEG